MPNALDIRAAMESAVKILAVDDEPSITESMRFIFRQPNYEVTGVNDSDDALTKLTEESEGYDIVITDQKMPFRSGIELVRELRKRNFTGKIMVLSANLSPELREQYEQMDVHVMVDKPFNIHDLRRALDSLAA